MCCFSQTNPFDFKKLKRYICYPFNNTKPKLCGRSYYKCIFAITGVPKTPESSNISVFVILK